jgi:RND family efflux transporter MFP subunit
MMRKTILVATLAALAMTRQAAGMDGHEPASTARPRPVVSTLIDDDIAARPSIPGVIAARIEVTLGFQTLGRITARNVDVGDVVSQGQLLASLNPDDLQSDVRTAQAAVESAREQERTALASAERARALAQRNVTSTAQVEVVDSALIAATAARQQAESELIRARDTEGYAEMHAPFAGVISAVYANAGAVVNAGDSVVQLSAQNEIEAVIDLPDAVLSRLKIGDRYDVWSETAPTELYPASVSQIEPIADAATRTRRVHLALGDDAELRLGALVRARPSGGGTASLSIPESAILDRDGTPHVWIVRRDGEEGSVTLRQIQPQGPALNGRIIVQKGIAAGEEVVTRGIHSLTEGQAVGERVAP